MKTKSYFNFSNYFCNIFLRPLSEVKKKYKNIVLVQTVEDGASYTRCEYKICQYKFLKEIETLFWSNLLEVCTK